MKRLFPLVLVLASWAGAQTGVPTRPDCDFGFTFNVLAGVITSTSSGSTNRLPPSQDGGNLFGWDNRTTACTNWVLTYQTEGVSTVSIELDQASSAAGIPSTWATWALVSPGTVYPLTALNVGQGSSFGYQPWVSVNLNSAGGTGTVYGRVWGWRSAPGQGGTGTVSVQGGSAPGTPETTNPIPSGGWDGTNVQYIGVDSSNRVKITGQGAAGAAVSGNPVLAAGTDGANAQTIGVDSSNRVKVIGTGPVTSATALSTLNTPAASALVAGSASPQPALTTAVVVKASAGNLYGFQVTNGAASVCYLEFMNVASAPTLGTGATYSFAVPASGTLTLQPGSLALSNYSTGISVGMATTYNGNTACGTAATAVVFYF